MPKRIFFLLAIQLIFHKLYSQHRPLQVSGVYPSFAAFNSPPDRPRPEPECGIGALVPWAGRLWYISYTSHALYGGTDKLHSIDENYRHEVRPESVGGTHAARLIHNESGQLFIGCYVIGKSGNVRVIPRKDLPGRLTAITTHLTDPAGKVLYYTQECSLYEVDVHTLQVQLIEKKALPGWHAKGAATAQGVVVVSHNGEEPGPSPFWGVDYDNVSQTEREVAGYLKAPRSTGPEDLGVLGEWNGKDWKVIRRNQYVEVFTPGGATGTKSKDAPIWATGWDKRSLLLSVRHQGKWSHYRMLKPSYTLEGPHGSNTEWPRIKEVSTGRYMAFMNGGLYDFPNNLIPGNTGGLRPISTLLRTVTDWASWQDQLVLASQETSVHGIPFLVNGQPQSNLLFTHYDELKYFGAPAGWGGVWYQDTVKAGKPSDALLIAGYPYRTLHLSQKSTAAVTFRIEIDKDGKGTWSKYQDVTVPANGYTAEVLPVTLKAEWMRITANRNVIASAYVHGAGTRPAQANERAIFAGLAAAGAGKIQATVTEIVRPGFPTRNLQFLTKGQNGEDLYYEVDENLNFTLTSDADAVNKLKTEFAIREAFTEDQASIIVTNHQNKRFRLPKSPHGTGSDSSRRGMRELVQERWLANLGGIFYEVPRHNINRPDKDQFTPKEVLDEFRSTRNLPDYARMKPVTTHGLSITDYCTWRGLLVLAGIGKDAKPDGQVFRAGAEQPGLWFGAIDDLWKAGKPVGTGGPWKNTAVKAGETSDPYLMTNFDKKTLAVSHDAQQPVIITIELDFLANNTWNVYKEITVPAGKTIQFDFPPGFSAHWMRVLANRDCKATAWLTYE